VFSKQMQVKGSMLQREDNLWNLEGSTESLWPVHFQSTRQKKDINIRRWSETGRVTIRADWRLTVSKIVPVKDPAIRTQRAFTTFNLDQYWKWAFNRKLVDFLLFLITQKSVGVYASAKILQLLNSLLWFTTHL